LIVDTSDGVHGRVRATASLYFVLAAQAGKSSLSASVSLEWSAEAQKRHARNSDGNAAIIKVLGSVFSVASLIVVALGRSSWWQNWARNRNGFFF